MFLTWYYYFVLLQVMKPSSFPQPSQSSFKQIVVQDASTSTLSAPTTHHHNPNALTEIHGSLNIDDIPVIDEKDLTDISFLSNCILLVRFWERICLLKSRLSKSMLDWQLIGEATIVDNGTVLVL